jgi:plastocyanin
VILVKVVMMRNLRGLAGSTVLLAALAVTACGGGPNEQAATTPPPDARRVDPATAATLTGKVLFEGDVPKNAAIKMAADPACEAANPNGATFETYEVDNGGLENVFVYVKSGLDTYFFEVPTDPVTLAQDGCAYKPHVLGIRVGQPLLIVNDDATVHNVHAIPEKNEEFNLSQALQGMKSTRTFTTPEVMVPFRCNVHSWMNAYVGVLDHPFFAVTHDGGQFEITGLPPGTYTIEAWHERLGTKTQDVTVGPSESKTIDFTFTPPASTP